MEQVVYVHPRCTTCKKACAFLDQKGIDYKTISIIDHPPSIAELKKMLLLYKGDIKKLFNTSGDEYKRLQLKDRLAEMDIDQALQLLASNGMLIKRPFVLTSQGGLVGFKEQEWQKEFQHTNHPIEM